MAVVVVVVVAVAVVVGRMTHRIWLHLALHTHQENLIKEMKMNIFLFFHSVSLPGATLHTHNELFG